MPQVFSGGFARLVSKILFEKKLDASAEGCSMKCDLDAIDKFITVVVNLFLHVRCRVYILLI